MSTKSAKRQARRAAAIKRKSRGRWLGALALGLAALAFVFLYALPQGLGDRGGVSFPHIHGLAFSSDGEQLIVPAHDGFRVYSQGVWSIPEDAPRRDYMGYSAVEGGFYSSGHPEPGSLETNPLGLVRGEGLGNSITVLGFQGESDFHVMAAGYENRAIYVLNPSANSQLPAGLHYSLDEGETWQQAPAQGLASSAWQLAVHPTEPAWVAAASEGGLLLSTDFGTAFQLVGSPEPVTGLSFSPSGERLLFGDSELRMYDLESGEVTPLGSPGLEEGEWILYIAENPTDANHLAIGTSLVNIFWSEDGGATWRELVSEGVSQ